MTIITTCSGQMLDLAGTDWQDMAQAIKIKDIAHHLSLINRFAGATPTPYSVAQHSLLVVRLLEQAKADAVTCLWGLLHDAHEAYLGDIITPAKQALFGAFTDVPTAFEELSGFIDMALWRKLFPANNVRIDNQAVDQADALALATEWRWLMEHTPPPAHFVAPANFRLKPMNWHEAEHKFLEKFEHLTALCGIQTGVF